jgi:hypothetical protein
MNADLVGRVKSLAGEIVYLRKLVKPFSNLNNLTKNFKITKCKKHVF